MLFKTLSASVYGIDAYLVEVEVDVGSARMTDFNVVGLPDNAVKRAASELSPPEKLRLRISSWQGVTINLAPADVRKEGSAFDLPMALGLTGCMGQFFGKVLDKCMFLGELSLDGSVRPVRGALSAALAAREVGLKSVRFRKQTHARRQWWKYRRLRIEITAASGGSGEFAGIVSTGAGRCASVAQRSGTVRG